MTHIDSSPIFFSPEPEPSLNVSSRKPDDGGGKSGFAEVFVGMGLEPLRSPSAGLSKGPRPSEPDPLASSLYLQQVDLSPAMRLIMPATPVPDLASLQAFARSQGLDEAAIQQLLGDAQATPKVDVQANAQQASMDLVGQSSAPASENPAVALAMAGAALFGLPPLSMGLAPESSAELPPASMPLPGLLPPGLLPTGLLRAAQPARPAPEAPEAAALGQTAWAQPVEVIALDLTAADAPTDANSLFPATVLKGQDAAAQAGILRSWLLPKDMATPMNDGASTAAGLAVVSRAAGAESMMAADLSRLDPAAMASGEPGLAQGGPTFQADLLSQPLQTDALSGREGLAVGGRSPALHDTAAMAARAPAEAALPAGSGQEMADKLAQKMGEAIAQRLMSRLEQGNWQFRFVLHPKMMGEVQVNLHMQGGGLEGSFVSSHASTRELLSDGLQRLRDTLNASGMNVASLDVGAGYSSRQGQQSMAAEVAQPLTGSRGQSGAAQEEPVLARHRGSFGGEQGWDVLV